MVIDRRNTGTRNPPSPRAATVGIHRSTLRAGSIRQPRAPLSVTAAPQHRSQPVPVPTAAQHPTHAINRHIPAARWRRLWKPKAWLHTARASDATEQPRGRTPGEVPYQGAEQDYAAASLP